MDNKPLHQTPNIEATSVEEYLQRGWSSHVHGEITKSEADFRHVLAVDESSYEASYGLALSLKAQGRLEEARDVFQHTLTFLKKENTDFSSARTTMLRSMTEAQLKMLDKPVSGK